MRQLPRNRLQPAPGSRLGWRSNTFGPACLSRDVGSRRDLMHGPEFIGLLRVWLQKV